MRGYNSPSRRTHPEGKTAPNQLCGGLTPPPVFCKTSTPPQHPRERVGRLSDPRRPTRGLRLPPPCPSFTARHFPTGPTRPDLFLLLATRPPGRSLGLSFPSPTPETPGGCGGPSHLGWEPRGGLGREPCPLLSTALCTVQDPSARTHVVRPEAPRRLLWGVPVCGGTPDVEGSCFLKEVAQGISRACGGMRCLGDHQ